MTGWWRRVWSGRDQVQLVDLYTRQSLFAIAWLMIGVLLLGASPAADQHPTAYAVLLVGALVVGAASTWALRDATRLYPQARPLPRASGLALLGSVVVLVAVSSALPSDLPASGGLVAAFALAWGFGGLRDRRVLLALVPALGLVAWVPARDAGTTAYALAAGSFFVLTVRLSLWLLDIVVELDRGRTAQAALAVAEERLRFSRDVHDVLGRRLSAIAVQAELTATLVGRHDERAADRALEVRGLAHDALREARELARGYRAVDLEQELEGAVSLLRSAGIEADVDVRELPEQWHEPAAWVVREAVTNVLRHSRATRVAIGYADGVLLVRNDRSPVAPAADGSGLAGVRARLAPLGAGLETGHRGEEFVVRMVLP
ncbi:sensor histidine kinase [Nocardioides sp. SYSU DS0663]|uniref:sensor histidine kinase n=1 Tax=Nocardioides sp. SYSU DS0663 TaxID=3416445 RepID=UPI003F4B3DE6